MRKITMMLLMTTQLFIIAKAQENYSISIHAEVKDSLKPSIRKLQLTFYELYSYQNVTINSLKYQYDSIPDLFDLKLPIPAKESHLLINYTNEKTISPAYFYLKNYLIHDGGNFSCTFYPDSIVFSGKGSYNLNLQTRLFKAGIKYNYILPNIARYDDDTYFENNIEVYNRNFENQISLLKNYRGRISKSFYEYLYYQCLGWKNSMCVRLITNSFRVGDTKFNLRAIAFYKKKLQGMSVHFSNRSHLSPLFADFIYEKEKLDFKLNDINKSLIANRGGPILLTHILNKYKGVMGGRLLIIGLSDLPNTYENTYSFLDNTFKFRKESPYKDLFNKIKCSLTPKSVAFPFALPDSAGKIIKLADYKGKVVIVDFWFTGCHPCQVLAKKMSPIIDSFKGKDVVFITISIDKIKKNWILSLKEGKYTHDGSINLYTNGLGSGHPVITHYNIASYPRLLVIDKKGKLITAEPPRPSDSDLNATNKFINLIESAL